MKSVLYGIALLVGVGLLSGLAGVFVAAPDGLFLAGSVGPAVGMALLPALAIPSKPAASVRRLGIAGAAILLGTGGGLLLNGADGGQLGTFAGFFLGAACLYHGLGALGRGLGGTGGLVVAYACLALLGALLPLGDALARLTGEPGSILQWILILHPPTVIGETVLGLDLLRHPHVYRTYEIVSSGPYLPARLGTVVFWNAVPGILAFGLGAGWKARPGDSPTS